jgi:two-component system response regulator NreC
MPEIKVRDLVLDHQLRRGGELVAAACVVVVCGDEGCSRGSRLSIASRKDPAGPARWGVPGLPLRRKPQPLASFPRMHPDERSGKLPGMAKAEPDSHVRVLIVDDHAVVRSGLRLLLDAEPDIEVVGEAGSVAEARAQNRALEPQLVLMDMVMPDASGIEATRTLLAETPATRVLVLSMQDDPRYVREAFEAGASGYVLKEAADTEVVDAVREVAAGGRYVHPSLGAKLAAVEADERRRAEEDPLSEREREVLRLLALGHTNQEIAKRLYISVRTAETHRAHIMQKLRLRTRAELVRYALEQGMLAEAAP